MLKNSPQLINVVIYQTFKAAEIAMKYSYTISMS